MCSRRNGIHAWRHTRSYWPDYHHYSWENSLLGLHFTWGGLETSGTIPVFGVTPALIATLQVTEVIKYLCDFGALLAGKMLYFNGETMEFTFVDLIKKPDCKVCGGD